jgi:hypothetical protein
MYPREFGKFCPFQLTRGMAETNAEHAVSLCTKCAQLGSDSVGWYGSTYTARGHNSNGRR